MARSLKTLGVEALKDTRKRSLRQQMLGRITDEDCKSIIEMVDELVEFIEEMEEEDDG